MSPKASDPEPIDDDTVRVARAGGKDAAGSAPAHDEVVADAEVDASDGEDAVDERTVLSARRADATPASAADPAADADDLEATVLSRSAAPAPTGADAAAEPGPRRAPVEDEVPEPDEGSTMVVRRETRRRAARDLEALSADAPGNDPLLASTRASDVPAPVRRIARAPEPAASAYTARVPHAARVERSAPEAHPQQDYVDTAALDASARARRRAALTVAVVLGVCIAAVAVAGIIALVTAG